MVTKTSVDVKLKYGFPDDFVYLRNLKNTKLIKARLSLLSLHLLTPRWFVITFDDWSWWFKVSSAVKVTKFQIPISCKFGKKWTLEAYMISKRTVPGHPGTLPGAKRSFLTGDQQRVALYKISSLCLIDKEIGFFGTYLLLIWRRKDFRPWIFFCK